MKITLRKIKGALSVRTRIKVEGAGQTILSLSNNGVYRYYRWGTSTELFDLNTERRIREEGVS